MFWLLFVLLVGCIVFSGLVLLTNINSTPRLVFFVGSVLSLAILLVSKI